MPLNLLGLHSSYAAVLLKQGAQPGDVVHTLLGAENMQVYPAVLGAWLVGATVAFGDELMGAQALAMQVAGGKEVSQGSVVRITNCPHITSLS